MGCLVLRQPVSGSLADREQSAARGCERGNGRRCGNLSPAVAVACSREGWMYALRGGGGGGALASSRVRSHDG